MKEVAAILDSVKKASDIPGASQSLSAISVSPRDQGRTESVLQRMKSFATSYAATQYGYSDQQGSTQFSIDNTNPLMPELLRIENLLRLEALTQSFLGLNVGPPKEGENQETYTTRLLNAAAEKKDWRLVERILTAAGRNNARQQSNSMGVSQLSALQAFNSAQQLEKAAQYAPAIQAYRRVLSFSGQYIPVEEASERLRVLGEEHKDAIVQVDREEEIRAIVKSVVESVPHRGPPF